jgi:hypothetical protein
MRSSVYFWRDSSGAHEIDCMLDYGTKLYPVEIKAGTAVASDAFRGLEYWNELAKTNTSTAYLVYADHEKQIRKQANVIGWKNASSLVIDILDISKKTPE